MCIFRQLTNGAQDIPIMKLRSSRGSPPDANLGCAQLPCLDGFFCHLIEGQEIGIVLARTRLNAQKLAANEADVREVDVAVHDVRNDVPPPIEPIRDRRQGSG